MHVCIASAVFNVGGEGRGRGLNGLKPLGNVGNFGVNRSDENTVICVARKRLKDVATRCILRAVKAFQPGLHPGPQWGSL